MVAENVKCAIGRFEVPVPRRSNMKPMPNSREIALKILGFLKTRLLREPQLKIEYTRAMQHNIDMGYMEKVDPAVSNANLRWYLPHHPVVNPKKPGKVRVVFDCAAKCQGVSLNGHILQGQDWTAPLV